MARNRRAKITHPRYTKTCPFCRVELVTDKPRVRFHRECVELRKYIRCQSKRYSDGTLYWWTRDEYKAQGYLSSLYAAGAKHYKKRFKTSSVVPSYAFWQLGELFVVRTRNAHLLDFCDTIGEEYDSPSQMHREGQVDTENLSSVVGAIE